jgi:hypothetical protein
MLTLIRREIYDNLVYVLAPCALSLLTVGILLYLFLSGVYGPAIPFGGLMLLVLFLAFAALGAAQMYGDQARRVSSLLATLATTRARIFAARVLTGILVILATLGPVLAAAILLLRMSVTPFAFYRQMVVEISAITVLAALACYGVGLLVGGTTSRVWVLAGTFGLLVLCVSLIVVKGFGPEAMLVFAVLGAALLVHTRHQFTGASL